MKNLSFDVIATAIIIEIKKELVLQTKFEVSLSSA